MFEPAESDDYYSDSSTDGRVHCEDGLEPGSYAFGLDRDYVQSWTSKDAFREFYQNWKDAIVASYNVNPLEFAPKWKETNRTIKITVHREVVTATGRPTAELLGYILFDKKKQSLEISNFNAKLDSKNLRLGGTTKRGNDSFAGTHGEGFKIAALVMLRSGYAVRITASSFYWNFGFRGTHKDIFYCRLSRPREAILERKKAAFLAKDSPRKDAESCIWNDVSFEIKKPRGCSTGVSEDQFREWAKVSFELDPPPPDKYIRTKFGDLILADEFSGRIYLKGLQLSCDNSPGGERYKYGYNFACGAVNRDRERMATSLEEASLIASIWEAPITEGRGDVTQKYLSLFRKTKSPDLSLIDRVVSEPVVKRLWAQLKADSPGNFFYCDSDLNNGSTSTDDQASLIVTSIKKQPHKISATLWKVLRKFSIVNTPQEESLRLFESSDPIDPPYPTSFARDVLRLMKASLLLDPCLEGIQLRPVTGGETQITIAYQPTQRIVLIHGKCLDFAQNHINESYSCDAWLAAQANKGDQSFATDEFSCHHIVEDLFESVLANVSAPLGIGSLKVAELRRMARRSLGQIPSHVKVQVMAPGELEVSWIGNEGNTSARMYGSTITYHVTLHTLETCDEEQERLVHPSDGGEVAPCGCPSQVVPRTSCKAVFKRLDSEKEYFAMISRTGKNTIFSRPSASVIPNAVPQGNRWVFNSYNVSDPVSTPRYDDWPSPGSLPGSPSGSLPGPPPRNYLPDPPEEDSNGEQRDNVFNTDAVSPDFIGFDDKHVPYNSPSPPPDPSDVDRDRDAWAQWVKEELPSVIGNTFPQPRVKCQCKIAETPGVLTDTITSGRLDCELESKTCFRVWVTEEGGGREQFIIFIHEIHLQDIDEDNFDDPEHEQPSHLVVTKYCPMESQPLLQQLSIGSQQNSTGEEVILHYTDFHRMGGELDAEVIDIKHIEEAAIMESQMQVAHCARVPPNPGDSIFCRFACSAPRCNSMVITPLAPHLLPHRVRLRPPRFTDWSNTCVIDLTPDVLGPLEGFSEAGFKDAIGLGFDPAWHWTWRMRYPNAQIADGAQETILSDFTDGRLIPPPLSRLDGPTVTIAAGRDSEFRLTETNSEMAPVHDFLEPVRMLEAMACSPFYPGGFTVLQMTQEALHPVTFFSISEHVTGSLMRGNAVSIRVLSLPEHGIPQKDFRPLLFVGGPPPVVSTLAKSLQATSSICPSEARLEDFIGDLSFKNPRVQNGKTDSFICLKPAPAIQASCTGHAEQANNTATVEKYIYNHSTSLDLSHKDCEICERKLDLSAKSIDIILHAGHTIRHPDRNDDLTVRELARLQGFKDDFIFYGNIKNQYDQVLFSYPPAITRTLAEGMKRALHIMKPVVGKRNHLGRVHVHLNDISGMPSPPDAVPLVGQGGGNLKGIGYKRPAIVAETLGGLGSGNLKGIGYKRPTVEDGDEGD